MVTLRIPGSRSSTLTRKEVFVELETDRTKEFVGEPGTACVTVQPRRRQTRFMPPVLRLDCTRSCVLAAAAGRAAKSITSRKIAKSVRFIIGGLVSKIQVVRANSDERTGWRTEIPGPSLARSPTLANGTQVQPPWHFRLPPTSSFPAIYDYPSSPGKPLKNTCLPRNCIPAIAQSPGKPAQLRPRSEPPRASSGIVTSRLCGIANEICRPAAGTKLSGNSRKALVQLSARTPSVLPGETTFPAA